MAIPTPADNLGELSGYHSPQVDVEVRLNTNESPFQPPPAWSRRVAEATASIDFNRYPDRGYARLRKAIGDQHRIGPDWVFAANGSNEVLQTLFHTYGGSGRTAVLFEPTYAMHRQIAYVTGTSVVAGERDDDMRIPLAEATRVVADASPSLTFVCSPNNPSGTVEPRETVETLVGLDAGLVVVDEAYGQFASWTAADLVDVEVPLVVTRTYSKTWSMAGLRLGYLIGPPEVVAALDARVLPYHLDALKQEAGAIALEFRADMERAVDGIVSERRRVLAALGGVGVETWDSEANFILFRPRVVPGDEVWQALVERSVLVRNCSSWPRLADCLRVTIGTPEENDRFVDALTEVLT
ncbi:MAG: histidinol-phosphate transaminase [Acidimicrobiales bacterium]